MKNVKKILSIISLMLVITLTLASCGNGTTNPLPAARTPQKTVYRSGDIEGNVYRLEVTENVSGRAAYIPQAGDTYVLKIIYADTDKESQTSSGTVEAKAADGTLELKPAVAAVTFTIKIEDAGMKTISGTITFEDNSALEKEEGIPLEKKPLTETDKMDIWLAEQPANTPATAYSYKLTIDDNWEEIIAEWEVLKKHSNKYVKLDLSASTITWVTFNDCKTLVGITLPKTVKWILDWGFGGCSNLTGVNIPNSVTVIGERAFGASGLTGVTIPNGVTTIGDYAFSGCNLTSVKFERNDTTIGTNAFSNTASLQSAYTAGGTGTYTISGSTWSKS